MFGNGFLLGRFLRFLKKSLMFVWRLLGHNISFLTANSYRTCNRNPRWACVVKKTETNISQRALIRHNHSLLNVLYSSPVGITTFGATPVSTACETKQLKSKCCSVKKKVPVSTFRTRAIISPFQDVFLASRTGLADQTNPSLQ